LLINLVALAWSLSAQEPVDSAAIALGKKVFEGKAGGAICFTCHAPNAKGVAGLGPDLTDSKWLHGDGSLAFLETLIKSGVTKPKQSAAPMPPMGGANLSAEQLRAVAAYVYSLTHPSK
jgi:cbb3-type cytochrome c oxidase subunit III